MSDASDVEGRNEDETNMLSDDSDAETAEEKRLRLAKKYLEEIERQGNYQCYMKTELDYIKHYLFYKDIYKNFTNN